MKSRRSFCHSCEPSATPASPAWGGGRSPEHGLGRASSAATDRLLARATATGKSPLFPAVDSQLICAQDGTPREPEAFEFSRILDNSGNRVFNILDSGTIYRKTAEALLG